MAYLAVLVLSVITFVLWRRVGALERFVATLDRPVAPARVEALSEPEPAAAFAERAPVPTPVVAPEPETWRDRVSVPTMPRFDIEDVFGRLLPIWAGGVTLAVAGFFLVRWSIDAGLLTPGVRVLLAGLFGVALVVGAEVAYRWREKVADPRVAQALAGAGLATLYATFYLAGTTYGLIGPAFAFVGLAAVTGAAIALSFRFGLPSAVLALVGGFAAPALVGGDEANLPLLTLYLALVTAGLAITGRRQDRAWLAIASLAGGLGWGTLLIASGPSDTPDVAVLGAYLVLLGGIVPALAGGGMATHRWVRMAAAGLAALQLAALVQQGGFGGLEWGLYLLLGAALAWFGWRELAMREGNAVAAVVAVGLTAFWPTPASAMFAAVAFGIAALFAGVPLAQLARGHGRLLDVGQASGVALGLAATSHMHFSESATGGPEPILALGLAGLACVAAGAAWLSRRTEGDVRWGWAAQAVAVLVAYDALAQVASDAWLAWVAAIVAVAVAWRSRSLVGALAMLVAIAAAWASSPIAIWLEATLTGLVGTPILAAALPTVTETGKLLLPLGVAAAGWFVLARPASVFGARTVAAIALTTLTIAAHVAYRHAFAGVAGGDFAATGVIERAVWEALLLGGAWIAHARGSTRAAVILALASLAHFAWFAIGLHNPLWAHQLVGTLPLANALVPAYAAGIAALVLLRRWLPAEPSYLRWAIDAATMIVIALFSMSQLRQAFAGSWLGSVPVSPTEDLLRSLMGILLAIGFLLWGTRTGSRTWRIGSLAAMVVAVLKVFLVDAAGLEGLARIASFMALGFSLIGIGWFYNRQLRAPTREIAAP